MKALEDNTLCIAVYMYTHVCRFTISPDLQALSLERSNSNVRACRGLQLLCLRKSAWRLRVFTIRLFLGFPAQNWTSTVSFCKCVCKYVCGTVWNGRDYIATYFYIHLPYYVHYARAYMYVNVHSHNAVTRLSILVDIPKLLAIRSVIKQYWRVKRHLLVQVIRRIRSRIRCLVL